MDQFIRLVGPNRAVEIGGVKLVGVTAENGGKLLLTVAFVLALLLAGWVLRRLAALALGGGRTPGPRSGYGRGCGWWWR